MDENVYLIPQLYINLLVVVSIIILILLIFLLIKLYLRGKKLSKQDKNLNEKEVELVRQQGIINEKNTLIGKIQSDIEVAAKNLADNQFANFKEKELETHRKIIIQAAVARAEAMLSEWKMSEGDKIRKDAVKRSMGVNFGKITEHLIPFSTHLEEFDPRDIRFIGSPVDLMIFDGATEKADEIDIYFVEIKTGTGQLSKKQKTLRDAIESFRVHWKQIVVPEFKWDVPDE